MAQPIISKIEHVQLDCSRGDTEPSRYYRLHRVIGYALALAGRDNNGTMFGKVARLEDHKGDLTVGWIEPPTDLEKSYFDAAWQDGQIGDGGNPAEHFVE